MDPIIKIPAVKAGIFLEIISGTQTEHTSPANRQQLQKSDRDFLRSPW